MPTVLDSLVLELGLDSSKFSRGEQEAMASLRKMSESSRRETTEVEAHAKRSLDLLAVVRREAIGALAVFFGGEEAKQFVQYATTLEASVGRLGATLGMSAQNVSAWEGALQQIGGAAGSADSALNGLNAAMTRFNSTGQISPEMVGVLSRLGVGLYGKNNEIKTSGELWLEIADAIQKLGLNSRDAATFLQMIPGANADMVNFALLGRRGMEGYLAAALKAWDITQKDVQAAQDLQREWGLLARAADGLGAAVLRLINPLLIPSLKWITRTFEGAPDAAGALGKSDVHVSPGGYLPTLWHHAKGWWSGAPSVSPHQLGIEALRSAFASVKPAAGMPSNWSNFLSGLSYLETSQRDLPGSPGHSAAGYFQFQPATAARAGGAGIADPRAGSYGAQAARAQAYVRRFHPSAAAAIDRGDFASAITELRGEWPSLPGGAQPQSASRYATFAQELAGGGPRPPGSGVVNINGDINVVTQATDSGGISRAIARDLQHALNATGANSGPQ